jgi:hypothetical protein
MLWRDNWYVLRIDTLKGEDIILHRLAWLCQPEIAVKIRSLCDEIPCRSPRFTQIGIASQIQGLTEERQDGKFSKFRILY